MNILIVRIGRMGDMAMILPAIQALRQRYPHATLHALTSVDGARLLPLVGILPDNICVYSGRWYTRWWNEWRRRRWLAQRHFDQIYCFERKPRTLRCLPASAQIIQPQAAIQHYALRCLTMVSPVHDLANQGPWIAVPKLPDSLFAPYGITANTRLIGLHLGYSGYGRWIQHGEDKHRRWPVAYYSALTQRLTDYAKQHGIDLKIVFNVLPQEEALGRELIAKSHGQAISLPITSEFSGYLSYLKRLQVLVVANTGVLHLASALHTPAVCLFSNYDPEDCGPWVTEHRAVVLRAEHMPNPNLGLASIPVLDVFKAVISLLGD